VKATAGYGVTVSRTSELRAIYAPRVPKRLMVYHIAFGDFMNRPVVHSVDISGLGPAGGGWWCTRRTPSWSAWRWR
jgi:hypothetical protein